MIKKEATFFVASRGYDIVQFPNFKKKVGTDTKWIKVPRNDEFYQLKDELYIYFQKEYSNHLFSKFPIENDEALNVGHKSSEV